MKLLVIEDNIGDFILLKKMLNESSNKEDYSIIHAKNLSAGIEEIDNQSFDVILLDLSLPDGEGEYTFTSINLIAQNTPIIILSGQKNDALVIKMVELGAEDYLVKGYLNPFSLIRAINYAIYRKKTQLELIKNQEKLKEAQKLGRVGSWEFDTSINEITFSEFVYDLFQIDNSRKCFTPADLLSFFTPNQYSIIQKKIGEAVKNCTLVSFDIRANFPLNDPFHFYITAKPVLTQTNETRKIIGTIQDISERKKAEKQQIEQKNLTKQMLRIANSIYKNYDMQSIYNQTLKSIKDLIEYNFLKLVLINPDQNKIVGEIDYSNQVIEYFYTTKLITKRHNPVISEVIESEKTFFISTITESDIINPDLKEIPNGLQSIISTPIRDNGTTLAIIIIGHTQPGFYSSKHVNQLESIATQSSLVIQNLKLFFETEQQVSQLNALREIDQVINQTLDLDKVFCIILDQIRELFGIDAAIARIYNLENRHLRHIQNCGISNRELIEQDIKIGENNPVELAILGKPIQIKDFAKEQINLRLSSLISKESFQYGYIVPLISKNEVLGTLELFHRSDYSFTKKNLDFFNSICSQAAIAIENFTILNNLKEKNMELRKAYDETLIGWVKTLHMRDKETEEHTRRVYKMTALLAQQIGIKGEYLENICRGALLHDIGKMGVPDNILQKPGKLTEDEWKIMKKHPVFAHELLEKIDFLEDAVDIPYCHHEKWDGTGYPRGLSGNKIPLSARIFSIIDVWDALTSDRPYRKAWTIPKTLNYIMEQSGKHFDPKIVHAFIELYESNQINEPIQNLNSNLNSIYKLLKDTK